MSRAQSSSAPHLVRAEPLARILLLSYCEGRGEGWGLPPQLDTAIMGGVLFCAVRNL